MQRAIKWALSLLGSAAFLCGGFVILHGSLPPASVNAWLPAGNLAAARAGAASVLLQDGRLLITGGNDASGALATIEILDPATGFTPGPSMSIARTNHVAVLLQDGRVLVAGGTGADGRASQSAELFDPVANSWSAAGPLMVGRSGATATLLPSGQVLIAGGTANGAALASLELFDPNSNTFSLVGGTLSSARENHAAALLPDGRVLIAGGWDGTALAPVPPASTGTANVLASSDVFDPATGTVATGPALTAPRMNFTATTALDGSIVAIGGTDGQNDLASIDVLIPGAGAFALSGANLTTARQGHVAFLLPHNGNILVVGGTSSGASISSAELYTPWTGATSVTGAMASARSAATGSPLFQMVLTAPVGIEGALLVAGGLDASSPPAALPSAEVYGFATIKTDQTDYPPGVPVTITGSGWQPGEVVQMSLIEVPDLDNDSPIPLTATADENGNIINTSFSTDAADANIYFTLTAVGGVSQAQTTFTDAKPNTVTVAPSSVSVAPGGTAIYSTVTVNFNGNGVSCTADLSVSGGLPMGAGATFSPASLTSTGGNATSELDVTTTASGVNATPPGLYTFTVSAAPHTGTCQSGASTAAGTGTLIVFGAADHLAFLQQPTNTTAGASISPAVTVEVLDSGGHLVANSSASITVDFGTNAGGGTLSGTLTQSAINGVATFGDLSINKVGAGYTLTANSGVLTGDTSDPFNITVGDPTQLIFATQPGGGAPNAVWATQPVVWLADAEGNHVTSGTGSGGNVQLTIVSGTGTSGAVLTCTSNPLNSSGGVWTFAGCKIDLAGTNYQLHAARSSSPLYSGDSALFDIASADSIAPTTTKTVSTPKYGTNDFYVGSATTFTLSCEDNAGGSGCDKTFYTVIGSGDTCPANTAEGSYTQYSAPFSLSGADGEKRICFFSKDVAGNRETVQQQNHYLDTAGPTLDKTIGSPKYLDVSTSTTYVKSTTNIDVAASDSGSGVQGCTLKIDSGAVNAYTQGTAFNLPASDGSHSLEVKCKDNLDNESTLDETDVVDDTGPTASVAYLSGPKYVSGVTYVNSSTVFQGGCVGDGTGSGCDLGPSLAIDPGTATFGGFGNTTDFSIPNSEADGAKTLRVKAKDRLGNEGTAATLGVTLDNTKPTITINVPVQDHIYILNEAVNADYSCSDSGSGVDTCDGTVANGSPIDTATVGTKSFTVNSTDHVGNSDSKTVTYKVQYNFIGFLPPIDNLPVLNSAKGGQTIPVKWQLKDANGNLISDLGSLATTNGLLSAPIACSADPVAIVEETLSSPGATMFRFDGTQFIYNWQTAKSWGGTCRLLQVTLADGTMHYAKFQFK